MNTPKFRDESFSDRMFTVMNYVIVTFIFICVLYPLVYIVSASFSDSRAVVSGEVWLWPVRPGLDGYKAVLEYKQVWIGFRNSLIYTAIGTLISLCLTVLAAYPLSRPDFYGKNVFMFLFMFTTMFSGGLIPNYLLVRQLGMLNTIMAMVIPTAISVWNVIITRTYFQMSIPGEMLEAAQIDGCNTYQFVRKIVLPLSGPILAVITLFYVASNWNQYFNAMIYLKSSTLYPLQLVLKDILISNDIDASMLSGDVADVARREALKTLLKYSLIVISSAPLLLFYPFVEKHLVKGVMIGSLKG